MPLPAARNSLYAMRDMLTDPELCGWSTEQVTVISNPARADDLAVQIADLAEHTTGALLVYFVGHGTLSNRGDLCLTVTTTRPDRVRFTSLAWDELAEALRSSPAQTRIAILDCCFAGQAIEALTSDDGAALADLAHVQGVYTLTATTRNKTAHVPPGEQQFNACTSFTGELQALLTGGIPGRSEVLTFAEIYPVLWQRLYSRGLPVPSQRGTDSSSMFPFALNRDRKAQAEPPRQNPDETTWESIKESYISQPREVTRESRSPLKTPAESAPVANRRFIQIGWAVVIYLVQFLALWISGNGGNLSVRIMAITSIVCMLALVIQSPVSRWLCTIHEIINIQYSFVIYFGVMEGWAGYHDLYLSAWIGYISTANAFTSLIIILLVQTGNSKYWFQPNLLPSSPRLSSTMRLSFALVILQALVGVFQAMYSPLGVLLAAGSLVCISLFRSRKVAAQWAFVILEILITSYSIWMQIFYGDAYSYGYHPYSHIATTGIQVGLCVALVILVFRNSYQRNEVLHAS